jgi:hypothetical protein
MSDQERGLYRKYRVERLDDPTGKHAECPFFVLDIRHDPHAISALWAYIQSCRFEFPQLAKDLMALMHDGPPKYEEQSK